MGDTGVATRIRWSNVGVYFHQWSLGAVDAARRADVSGDTPTQQGRGATTNGPSRVQPEKMEPRPVPIADIIQPRPPQMLCADGVEERGHPVLHNHRIIGPGFLFKGEAVLEPFATPTRHCQTNPTGFDSSLCKRLLHHFYRRVG